MVDDNTVPSPTEDDARTEPAVVENVLVEEVSIDGMCGVY